MPVVNKIVGYFTSPMTIGLGLFLMSFIMMKLKRKKASVVLLAAGLLWMWIWSSNATTRWLGLRLEGSYPVVLAEDAPNADMIVVLGGGMGINTNVYPYAEMWSNADRVWHGARLYKAGKAPKIYITGGTTTIGTRQLLRDFGVPNEAIVANMVSRNTEEEAKGVSAYFVHSQQLTTNNLKPKVLLVTSAWHMRRAMLMFQKYASNVEVCPAPTDYESLVRFGGSPAITCADLVPHPEVIGFNLFLAKEYVGYWGYRLLR